MPINPVITNALLDATTDKADRLVGTPAELDLRNRAHRIRMSAAHEAFRGSLRRQTSPMARLNRRCELSAAKSAIREDIEYGLVKVAEAVEKFDVTPCARLAELTELAAECGRAPQGRVTVDDWTVLRAAVTALELEVNAEIREKLIEKTFRSASTRW